MFESKKNNVWFNIWNSLTASTSSTLLTILWWKETLVWADFGLLDITKHFKLTLTKFVWWVVSISEVVKVTAKSWNVLTIVRAYEPCPLNANATVMTQAPQVFDVWDFAYMNMTASDLIELWVLIDTLIDTKQNNCVMVTKSVNYTFTWNEANNTWFSTTTTSWNITYTLNPALFPTTNGMYEFTICKSTNDGNTVIIDVWAWKTIDTAQTYTLTNYMESVTIRIASSTFVKVIAMTNRNVVVAAISTTQSIFIAWENITAWNALYIHTDWKVYKTDATNTSEINFIWFATNTVSSWWNVIVDTAWVSATQTWLTAWSDYYLNKHYTSLLHTNILNSDHDIYKRIIYISEWKYVILYKTATNTTYAKVINILNWTITQWTPLLISSTSADICWWALVNTDIIAIYYWNWASTSQFLNKITVSWNTLLLWTPLEIANSSMWWDTVSICNTWINNIALVSFAVTTSANWGRVWLFDFNWATPSQITVTTISSTGRFDFSSIIRLNTNTAVMSLNIYWTTKYYQVLNFTSNSITLWWQTTTTQLSSSYIEIQKISDTLFWVLWDSGLHLNLVSWTNISLWTAQTFTSWITSLNIIDSNNFYWVWYWIYKYTFSWQSLTNTSFISDYTNSETETQVVSKYNDWKFYILYKNNSDWKFYSNSPLNFWAISTTPWTNVRRIWKAISTTAIELETSANNSLEGTLWTTATTWSVVLWNAVWYITVKINWVDRKIPYYS